MKIYKNCRSQAQYLTFALLAGLMGLTSSSYAADSGSTGVFGWDVKCVGSEGLEIRAEQSDDDMYITQLSGEPKFNQFWVDSGTFQNTSKTLTFKTSQPNSEGVEATLEVTRDHAPGFGYGHGTFTREGDSQKVNCYIRYGVGEDDFDTVSAEAFPAIAKPGQ